jgi:hypothetical protein
MSRALFVPVFASEDTFLSGQIAVLDSASYVALRFSSDFLPSLSLLLDAARFAEDSGQPFWGFAVSLDDLYRVGLTANAAKWLICKGYVEHRTEAKRSNRPKANEEFLEALRLPGSSRVILTATGIDFAARIQGASVTSRTPATATKVPRAPRPNWNARARLLRVGQIEVKRFTVPADNQERILSAFEEERWPPVIDDPLPPRAELDAKRRLHDAINRLNRNQKTKVLCFKGNGNGRAVRWEYVLHSVSLG